MAGRVFVIQDDGSKDLWPAMEHGKTMVVLCTRDLPVFHDPSKALADMRFKLRDFDGQDFLVPIGDPLLIGAAIHFAAQANGGVVPCLKWGGKRHKSYFPVLLTFN